MRSDLTESRLRDLMAEIARTAPRNRIFRVYLLGGGTAVLMGWRAATIDADMFAEREEVFRDIQGIKERLGLNIEFVRPEDFVPPLAGTADRHIPIRRIGRVDFLHYDPYAQAFSKIVRGFGKDLMDVREFIARGLVDPPTMRALMKRVPDKAFDKYPALNPAAVRTAVDAALAP